MPSTVWSAKRERQYAHVKDCLLEQGKAEPLAEEIAARVVNKERTARRISDGECFIDQRYFIRPTRRPAFARGQWRPHTGAAA